MAKNTTKYGAPKVDVVVATNVKSAVVVRGGQHLMHPGRPLPRVQEHLNAHEGIPSAFEMWRERPAASALCADAPDSRDVQRASAPACELPAAVWATLILARAAA